MTLDTACDQARACAQIDDAEVRHAPFALPPEAAFLPQHRARAVGDRRGDVTPAIVLKSGVGDESIAVPDAPAVGRKPPDTQFIDRAQIQSPRAGAAAS